MNRLRFKKTAGNKVKEMFSEEFIRPDLQMIVSDDPACPVRIGTGQFCFFHEDLNGQLRESVKIWLDNEIN